MSKRVTPRRKVGNISNVYDILTQLEALITKGQKVPITGKSMVDTGQLAALVSELRQALPQDLQKAREVLQQREGLLNQSLEEASRIRSQAEEEMKSRIEHAEGSTEAHEHADKVLKDADRRSQETISNAERHARRMQADAEAFAQERTNGANEYSHTVMLQLEEEVSRVLGAVRKGIDTLAQQREVKS